jgi:hypothetical protein
MAARTDKARDQRTRNVGFVTFAPVVDCGQKPPPGGSATSERGALDPHLKQIEPLLEDHAASLISSRPISGTPKFFKS